MAQALDRLIGELAARRLAAKSSALGWLFGKARDDLPVSGLYIHGGVGRGKTMLMDMFFALVPVRRKRRVHFNAFMAEVHDRIQAHRACASRPAQREADPIPPVAQATRGCSLGAVLRRVLCDRYRRRDGAVAAVLGPVCSRRGARRNLQRAPDELYKDGLNRQLFLPFVDLLKRHTQVLALDAAKDYRRDKLDNLPVYLTPLGPETDRRMDGIWEAISHGQPAHPVELTVMGRTLTAARAAGRAARFSFAELCEQPLAARDYLALAARFDTLVVDQVPVLPEARRNEAKRFILLIDTLYDRHIRLVLSAAAPPDALYQGRKGAEAFEFQRAASRLSEMQDRAWLEAWAALHREQAG